MSMKVGELYATLGMDTSGFDRDLDRSMNEAKGKTAGAAHSMSDSLTSFGKQAFGLGSRMTIGLTLPIVAGFKTVLSSASDMNETVSKAHTIFGPAGQRIEAWAGTAAKSFGQSKREALDAAATFGNLFVQLGVGSDDASKLSTQMVELASDFASFHNADPTQVIEAMTAAFRGEYDAVQRFVPTINAAAVEQKALAMTGKAATKELTMQEKALATQTLMMEGAGAAMGDFDRTADSAANKQRSLTSQMEDAKAAIGEKLLPTWLSLLGAIKTGVEWFSKLGQPMQTIILVVGGVLAVIGPLVAMVGALSIVLGVLLSPVGLVVGAIAALVAGVIIAYQRFEGFRNVVDAVAGFFVNTVWPKIKQFAGYIVEQFGNLVGWVRQHWGQIQEAIDHVINVVAGIVRTVTDVIMALWRAWGDDLLRIAATVWDFIRDTIENGINFVRSIIEAVLHVINGDWGKAWDAIKGALSAVWDQIKNVVSTAFDIVKSIIGGVLSTIGEVWRGAWDGIKGFLSDTWESIKRAVAAGLDAVVTYFRELPGRTIDGLRNLGQMLWDTATGAIRHMANGFLSFDFWGAVKGIFSGLLDKVKGFFGITSPSKVFEDLGRNMARGMANGITADADKVRQASQKLYDASGAAAAHRSSSSLGVTTGGLNPEFLKRFNNYNQALGGILRITSGWRSMAQQAALYKAKPGLAAPPGRSNHQRGLAIDHSPHSTAAMRATARMFGLRYPMGYEPWHVEPMARGGVLTRPTMALLAESAAARPEIVTPERLMRQIMREEGGGPPAVIVYIDGVAVAPHLVKVADDRVARRLGQAHSALARHGYGR